MKSFFDIAVSGHPGVYASTIDLDVSSNILLGFVDDALSEYMTKRGVRFVPACRSKLVIRAAQRRKRFQGANPPKCHMNPFKFPTHRNKK